MARSDESLPGSDDSLPVDPDWDDVPLPLRHLAGDPVTVLCTDGVSQDVLVVAPGLFAHARRVTESE